MCIISEKIKFCSCATGDVSKLKHYWILHRFTKEKETFCMGTSMMPTSMTDLNFEINQSTLLKRINETDAFDVPIKLISKDLLEIVINNIATESEESSIYTFEYKKNKWVTVESDPFEIMNNFDEEQSGKVKSALKHKLKK